MRSSTKKSFWQTHENSGFRATVTVEWSWPDNVEPPQNWQNDAEEIAEEAFAASGPRAYDIVQALRGKTARAPQEK